MKVSRLMKLLSALDPDTKIVVRGYEDGYDDIGSVEKLTVKKVKNQWWYSGEYRDVKRTEEHEEVIHIKAKPRK